MGKLKDMLFPNPRVDFYACVEARKKKSSPHGGESADRMRAEAAAKGIPEIRGLEFKPKYLQDPVTGLRQLGPFY